MSNLKKDIDEILNTLYEDILVSESELADGDRKTSLEIVEQALKQATTQIINLIESELLTVREELIEQVRDKKPAKLKSVRGAKNVSSARIGYIGGWNAYYEKLQPILTDIKNKLIDGEKK